MQISLQEKKNHFQKSQYFKKKKLWNYMFPAPFSWMLLFYNGFAPKSQIIKYKKICKICYLINFEFVWKPQASFLCQFQPVKMNSISGGILICIILGWFNLRSSFDEFKCTVKTNFNSTCTTQETKTFPPPRRKISCSMAEKLFENGKQSNFSN